MMQVVFQCDKEGYQFYFNYFKYPLSVLLVQGRLDMIRRHVDKLLCLP